MAATSKHTVNDVILVLGPLGTTRVPANSQVLSAASSVFAAMFSGKFAEGKSLSIVEPEEVKLPDDDFEAMTIVLDIVHYRNYDVPPELKRDQILAVARVVDKYRLAATFKWVVACWFRDCECSTLDDCTVLATAAYLMQDQSAYTRFTKEIVIGFEWTVGQLLEMMTDDAVPDQTSLNVVLAMERQHATGIKGLSSDLQALPKRVCTRDDCMSVSQTITRLEGLIQGKPNAKFFGGLGRATIKEAMKIVADFKAIELKDSGGYTNHRHSNSGAAESEFRSSVKTAELMCRGMCLTCLREGKPNPEACADHLKT